MLPMSLRPAFLLAAIFLLLAGCGGDSDRGSGINSGSGSVP